MPDSHAVIYLVRHAHSTANAANILAGRTPGIALSVRGRAESELLAKRLHQLDPAVVLSSPLQRCLETIAPFKSAHPNVVYKKDPRFQEMDYGTWSGKKLKYLSALRLWNQIQSNPASVRFPEGESFLEMSARSNSGILDAVNLGKSVVVVSHGDVIKSIISHQIGMSVANLQKFIVDPASISTISISGAGSLILSLNDTSHLASLRTSKVKPGGTRNTLGGGSGVV